MSVKIEGETGLMFQTLLTNLCEDYHITKSASKAILQKALRDTDVLNLVADKAVELLSALVSAQHEA